MINTQSWLQSTLIHLALAMAIGVSMWIPSLQNKKPSATPIRVIEAPTQPKEAPPVLDISTQKPKELPKPRKAPPAFGLNKNTLTANSGSGVQVKEGNTLAKEVDQTPATDALPVPTEEFLVSKMPRLKTEVRVEYPAEAKSRRIEGPVVMEILIDSTGKVRDLKLLEGPGFGLNEAALAAIAKFEFEPATVDGKPVAVKIRYTYRFVLTK